VDNPGGPLSTRNDAGVSPEQTKQAQRRRLFHHVQSVAEIKKTIIKFLFLWLRLELLM